MNSRFFTFHTHDYNTYIDTVSTLKSGSWSFRQKLDTLQNLP